MKLAFLPIGDGFHTEVWTLLAISIVTVVLRCLARIQITGVRKLRLDDYGMKVAVVGNTFSSTTGES